jgi:hypothetical protein
MGVYQSLNWNIQRIGKKSHCNRITLGKAVQKSIIGVVNQIINLKYQESEPICNWSNTLIIAMFSLAACVVRKCIISPLILIAHGLFLSL